MSTQAARVLYSRYFNSEAKQKQGRRVSLTRAVSAPTLTELFAAVHSLGFTAEMDAAKRYPRSTVDDAEIGCLRVTCVGVSKEELLRCVGSALVEARKARCGQTETGSQAKSGNAHKSRRGGKK